MKKQSVIALVLFFALLTTPIIAAYAITPITPGSPPTIPPPAGIDNPLTSGNEALSLIEWYQPTGYADMLTLSNNPEWLKLWTNYYVHSTTTIVVQGTDVWGKNVEGKVVIPQGTPESRIFVFNDTHTDPPVPVTFASITGIYQQNGTNCNSFQIRTHDVQYEEFLGYYAFDSLDPGFSHGWHPSYFIPHGNDIPATPSPYPYEPANPEPIKILINWLDEDGDLYPDQGTGSAGNHNGELYPQETSQQAQYDATVWIEGLDARGNKLIISVEVNAGDSMILLGNGGSPDDPVFSTICKVWGGAPGDEYYILTEPQPQRNLFTYRIRIHHITIHPDSYDILANPDPFFDPIYPGHAWITVALRDIDDHFVHWGDPNPNNYIIVNFATSAGRITPSNDVRIYLCQVTARALLCADTNARTINVTANANVPLVEGKCPGMNLFAWTELTEDGINSVRTLTDGAIHVMMWGYNSQYYNYGTKSYQTFATFTGPVPPKPWLPPELGGPEPTDIKFDGPIYEVEIPIWVGCNLISSPVHPILSTIFHTGYPTIPNNNGIPMELLFGATSAQDCIEIIWWYEAGQWGYFIPATGGVRGNAFFRDGLGYWIKAEKECTLEISGVVMENAPFTPPEYPVYPSWNLVGFTGIERLETEDYLQSLSLGNWEFWGPVWTYTARGGYWTRNPGILYPTYGFWMYYKGGDEIAPFLAP